MMLAEHRTKRQGAPARIHPDRIALAKREREFDASGGSTA
jgi:hypothetical protein